MSYIKATLWFWIVLIFLGWIQATFFPSGSVLSEQRSRASRAEIYKKIAGCKKDVACIELARRPPWEVEYDKEEAAKKAPPRSVVKVPKDPVQNSKGQN